MGIIDLSNQIAGIIGMLVFLGLPAVIVKETSIAYQRHDWNRIKDVIYTSLRINVPLSILVIGIAYLLIPYLVDNYFEEALKIPLTIIIIAVFFQVFSKIFASGLNGRRKIWQSSLVGDVLSAGLVGIGILFFLLAGIEITVIKIALIYALSRSIVAIVVGIYWRKISKITDNHYKHQFIPTSLLKVGLPLLFVQATNTIANSVDSIMIGSILTSKDVGLYAVAFKIAFVSSFFLMVTNAVLAPKIASLYAENKIIDLEKTIQKVTKILILIGVGSFLLIIFVGPFALKIWGFQFSNAYVPLIILSIGQLFNIGAGCVGLILTMCGQEKNWGYVTLGSALLNTVLNVSFINIWGITGAAIATASTMILVNISGVIIVKNKIGIITIPIKLRFK